MATRLIVPAALRPGDTISFISPSNRPNTIFSAPIGRAQALFESLGYKIRIVFFDLSGKSYLESVRLRCEEIHSVFRDNEVKAIICTIGGSTCNELVAYLDYDLIRSNPKIFCGYSDISILHCAILTQTGLQTFYAPSALAELGTYPSPLPFTIDHLLVMLTGSPTAVGPLPRSEFWAEDLPAYFFKDPSSQEIQKLSPSPAWCWLRPGKAQGRLVGGCFPTLLKLSGTKYWPSLKSRILFLETSMGDKTDLPYSLSKVRNNLADYANLGAFEQISGLVVGRPYKYDEEMRTRFGAMILEMCQGTNFPILLNVDFGHSSPMLTIPYNVLASLDSEQDKFSLLETCVSL